LCCFEILSTFRWSLPFLFGNLWYLIYGKYLGNPLGKTLAQRLTIGFGVASAGFTMDQIDRGICRSSIHEGVSKVIEEHKSMGHNITKEELFEIRRLQSEDCKNIPRVDQFSDLIKNILDSSGKK